jgi:hypothetical protein
MHGHGECGREEEEDLREVKPDYQLEQDGKVQ